MYVKENYRFIPLLNKDTKFSAKYEQNETTVGKMKTHYDNIKSIPRS